MDRSKIWRQPTAGQFKTKQAMKLKRRKGKKFCSTNEDATTIYHFLLALPEKTVCEISEELGWVFDCILYNFFGGSITKINATYISQSDEV